MEVYFNDTNDRRNDGAALRIANSPIPPEFYTNAPQIVALPSTIAPNPVSRWNVPFVVAGFSGAINRFSDIAGFYFGGVRPIGTVGAAVPDFFPVSVPKNYVIDVTAPGNDHNNNATITWNENQVVTRQGLSGSPGLMHIAGAGAVAPEEIEVCSHDTNGIGGGFTNPPQLQNQFSVDPQSLLFALDAIGVDWELWVVPKGLGTW